MPAAVRKCYARTTQPAELDQSGHAHYVCTHEAGASDSGAAVVGALASSPPAAVVGLLASSPFAIAASCDSSPAPAAPPSPVTSAGSPSSSTPPSVPAAGSGSSGNTGSTKLKRRITSIILRTLSVKDGEASSHRVKTKSSDISLIAVSGQYLVPGAFHVSEARKHVCKRDNSVPAHPAIQQPTRSSSQARPTHLQLTSFQAPRRVE